MHPMTSQPTSHTQTLDLSERGANDAKSDRRLFMQLHAFGECLDTGAVIEAMQIIGVDGVLYEDLHDPQGIAVVLFSEHADDFVAHFRRLLHGAPFNTMAHKSELSMFGRTYAIGYERDLDETLVHRPRRTLLNPEWTWAVWYPLRRRGGFAQLPRDERMDILKEHGAIGMQYGAADLAHDIRLACHGLDRNDNDFVIGLTGAELAPLSKLVETMRPTKQTSTWIERLGPFFVGRKVWHSA
ncbi:MAG: hypothetical protein GVY24_04845 [Planctomycetes bacterium]|jgi:chlorite dismutase|nr:hypothetical protein [Planctomycetota bacterium]